MLVPFLSMERRRDQGLLGLLAQRDALHCGERRPGGRSVRQLVSLHLQPASRERWILATACFLLFRLAHSMVPEDLSSQHGASHIQNGFPLLSSSFLEPPSDRLRGMLPY